MDGNTAMNSEFENMSEKDMEQQEKIVWVDQGWPKHKTPVTLVIEMLKNEGQYLLAEKASSFLDTEKRHLINAYKLYNEYYRNGEEFYDETFA